MGSLNLQKVLEILKQKAKKWDMKNDYRIPVLWDSFGYMGDEKKENPDRTLTVNPYNFISECIERCILPYADPDTDYLQTMAQIEIQKGDKEASQEGWIKKSSIYGMQIRTTSAWDHDGDRELKLENRFGLKDTGTFIKTIALLPLIKKMGFDTIYTLPITKNSTRYKKGEMGSPYAVKNFYELDPVLKDPMTEELSIKEEFAAFVEACHILGMRFVIDIIPRTSARDSDFILEHPDWFYWIRLSDAPKYRPPQLTLIKEFTKADESNIDIIYRDEAVKEHLKLFVDSPDKFAPEKWAEIKEACKRNPATDFFELIENNIGLTTAPAFSDCLNDPQPPWTDVTYLRLYLDHPVQSAKYVSQNQPPYILFDTIRANIFKGERPNSELWEMLSNIIVHYIKNFGVDGARIDMGHALPKELEDMIISKAKKADPHFCFIAEELTLSGDRKAKESGYDMIIGDLWAQVPRYYQGNLKKMIDKLLKVQLPVFAASEIPDSPRAASRLGGREFSRFSVVLNNFLPNAVFFLTSGQEVYEVQPMNLGLDPQKDGRFKLPKSDPFYGRLAFFDRFALHWTNDGAEDMIELISNISKIRNKFRSFIDANNFLKIPYNSKYIITFAYMNEAKGKEYLIVVANADNLREKKVELNLDRVKLNLSSEIEKIEVIFSLKDGKDCMLEGKKLICNLKPLDIKILLAR
ncbi:alpha-amylase family glycosyl hydrolase [Caldicellulosiruptor morganii]|uniref:Alpha-amylase family glycosyl hydrolase n=1 Tax=Caldicellulosiruptor morganii TaxID=1387555 RepID=A0ABY7BQA3_9FIRM|nr:alpha-amylase family glycosyl hydrolase [Caldicellulosiruptor morganii]WAM35028.1 alpha-amylase family glycosyl hydrolase [Caldicellulosiruptor morganii]